MNSKAQELCEQGGTNSLDSWTLIPYPMTLTMLLYVHRSEVAY